MPNPKHNSNLVLSRLKQIQEPLLRQQMGASVFWGELSSLTGVQYMARQASCYVIRAVFFHHKV